MDGALGRAEQRSIKDRLSCCDIFHANLRTQSFDFNIKIMFQRPADTILQTQMNNLTLRVLFQNRFSQQNNMLKIKDRSLGITFTIFIHSKY